MNHAVNGDLMLVGSIAYDTAEETFRGVAPRLGAHLAFMPDGEIGQRRYWINHIAYRLFHGHPDFETISRPMDNGVEAWGAGFQPRWAFKLRDGVDEVKFGEMGWRMGYATDAINSYFIFKTLKKEGVVPEHIRFQVCLPLTISSVRLYVHDPEDQKVLEPAMSDLLAAEVANICAHIPHDDLVIQWDCAIEDTVIEGALTAAGGVVTDEVRAVAASIFEPARVVNAAIPEAVPIGYHACYGTATGWPVREPQDLTGAVLLLNHAVASSGRRVDFLHMPTVKSEGPEYFDPLNDLNAGDARVYMGLIHALHDEGGMRRQMEWVSERIGEFGVAAPCGFGRGPAKMSKQTGLATPNDYMEGLLADHLAAVELLHKVRG